MATGFPRHFFIIGCILSVIWVTVVLLKAATRIFKVGRKAYFFVKRRVTIPEELQDPTLGQHEYIQLSGAKIHYVVNGPENAPLMLFVHGFPEFWYSWRHQIKEFSKNYRTVAIDMRGYGDSSKPLGVDNYTVDKLVKDVKEIIEGLGYEKCTLVAHDWGGIVCWNVAHMYPNLVERLIVCNIPHSTAFLEHIQGSWKQLLMSWYVFFFQLPFIPELVFRSEDMAFLKGAFGSRNKNSRKGAFTEVDIELYKYAFSKRGALNGPINYYRAMFRHGIPLDYPTEKVTVPTLMIWGVKDRALAKDLAEKSREFAADYRIKYVEASHWVQQEEPEIVNNHMTEFLSSKE